MKFIINVVLLLLSLSSYTQHRVLPDSCAVWNYDIYDSFGTFIFTASIEFEPNQDTIINSINYEKLRYSGFGTFIYKGAIRESNSKAYYVLIDSTSEYLVQDLGAAIGDTIFNIAVSPDIHNNDFIVYDGIVSDSTYTTSNSGASLLLLQIDILRYRSISTFPHVWNSGLPLGSLRSWWSERSLLYSVDGSSNLLTNSGIPILGPSPQYVGYCTSDDSIVVSGGLQHCSNCNFLTSVTQLNNIELKLVPNPTSSGVTLSINHDYENSYKQVQIINSMGQVIFNTRFMQKSVKIETSDWASGIYFVLVYSDNYIYQKRLVVQK